MPKNLRIALAFIALPLTAWIAWNQHSLAEPDNGFDLKDPLIPLSEILHGGPGRDGIPSIDHPKFIDAGSADYLKADDYVLGLVHNGIVRAYPIRILNWHEIVNDRIGNDAFVVSYCPLCGTGTVFSAELDGNTSRFGVSGLLYNSDLLLYDESTQSLWSQIMAQAVTGPLKGRRMDLWPVNHTTWSDWKAQHPMTQVLSLDTGHSRDYSRSPYGSYDINRARYFPTSHESRRFHPKERVIGLEFNGQHKAYAFAELPDGKGELVDEIAGTRIKLSYNTPARSGVVTDLSGKTLPTINAFWFAWYGFHPDTQVYERNPTPAGQSEPINTDDAPSRYRGPLPTDPRPANRP